MPEYHLIIQSSRPFSLGADHEPYMVLPEGGTGPFSCARCQFLSKKEGKNHCGNPHFQQFMGTSVLPDEQGRPLEDPSRACSDWFHP